MRTSLPILAALLLVAGTSSTAQAQFGPSLRGSGLSGAYAGLAVGHEAIDWNPALLGLDSGPILSLGLPRVKMAGALLGPTFRDLRDVLVYSDDLTDASRHDFLAKVPAEGLEIRGDLHLPWAALSVGPLAVGVSTTLLAGGTVGHEFMDLLLYTRQYGEVDPTRLAQYRVGNTTGREALFTTVKVGYGHALDASLPLPFPVSIGVTGRYVRGHSLAHSRLFEPEVDWTELDISVAALAVSAPRGTGYGLDVGVAARPVPGLTIGLAIDNIVQEMSWSEELQVHGDIFFGKELGELEVADLGDRLEGRPLDPANASPQANSLARGLSTEAHFPTVVRAGLAYRTGGTSLGATYSATQGDGDLHVGWPRYLAVGAEQKLPVLSFLALRAGMATSLSGANAVSGGASLRIGPVHIAAAVSRTSGTAEPGEPTIPSTRFAERMVAGSGYSGMIGVELLRF